MNGQRIKKVTVVDDDPAVRKAVGRLLKSSGFEVRSFGSGQEFLSAHVSNCPGCDCLVLDVCLPDLNGLQLQEELIKKDYPVPIIFITGHGDIPMSVKAMKKGAIDFIPKPFKDKEFLSAIDNAIKKRALLKKAHHQKENIFQMYASLTTREKEVFRWVITGMLNKQIAQELGTVEKTIRVHRGRVMKKMKVSSVAQLVRLAAAAGIPSAQTKA